MHCNRLFILFFLIICAAIPVRGQTDVPVLNRWITDQTGTLDGDEIRDLEDTLRQFEKITSNQVVVLIIETLNGGDLQDYAIRVGEKSRVGKAGKDNGVLLLIVMKERDIRIEVGYGLEGALPDALSDQIIRHEIATHFRAGDYYEGIKSGITAIIKATKGEYKADKEKGKNKISPIIIFIIIIIVGMVMRRLIASGGQYVGSGEYKNRNPWWWGGFGGGGGFGSGGFGGGGGRSGGGGGFSGGGGHFGGGGASGGW